VPAGLVGRVEVAGQAAEPVEVVDLDERVDPLRLDALRALPGAELVALAPLPVCVHLEQGPDGEGLLNRAG
jgi:hypothetical protein